MAGEWRDTILGEVVRLQRGHDLPDKELTPGLVPVMGSFGVTGWHNEARAKGPGVTIGRSGASIGVVSFIREAYGPLNTCLYVTDFQGNDPKFCYYWLRTLDLANYNSGSAQPSLNRNYIYGMPVRVPRAAEQRAIAHILGTLDDKIELNRRVNETLEAMARALFKSWFVDFLPVRAKVAARTQTGDPIRLPAATAAQAGAKAESRPGGTGLPKPLADLFPDSFEESELGEIPAGWRVLTVEDIAEINAWTLSRSDPLPVIDYIEVSEVMRGEISTIVRFARGGGAEQGTKATASWGHGAFYGSARPRCAFLVSTPQ
jgi:type I restriction enzyme S subunit